MVYSMPVFRLIKDHFALKASLAKAFNLNQNGVTPYNAADQLY